MYVYLKSTQNRTVDRFSTRTFNCHYPIVEYLCLIVTCNTAVERLWATVSQSYHALTSKCVLAIYFQHLFPKFQLIFFSW